MISWNRVVIALGIAVLSASRARAGIGPENVVVVVNGDSPASVTVANEYARLRDIPAYNIIVLHHLSNPESTDVNHFRNEILRPVLEAINDRGITNHIDCVTYSVDIPYSINVDADVKGRQLPQVITRTASINGLTYLSDWVMKGDIDYLRLDINRYARKLLPLANGKELTPAEQVLYANAVTAYDHKDYSTAIKGLTELLETPRSDPNIAYNLACSLALSGRLEEAVAALRKAVNAGWRNYGQTSSDPDLLPLKNLEGFQQILKLIKGAHIEVQLGAPFHHVTGWNLVGEPDPQGAHYLLSTVLGVTTGRGNSLDEVLNSLRRAAHADFTSPKGTIYFEKNGDVRSTTRQWGFEPAAAELRRLGVDAVVESGQLPKDRTNVAGAMIGTADFDWPASRSTILPGAICEHLTSCGGMLQKGAPQTPCSEFIRNGAAGTSGAVTEPYALQEKFPSPFIHVQYAKGFTLAESFYQSLSGPYQLLIIGDPLCRPWAKEVPVKVRLLPYGHPVRGNLTLKPSVSSPKGISEYQLFVDGRWVLTAKPTSPLTYNTDGLKPGIHQFRLVAVGNDLAESKYHTTFTAQVAASR